MLNEISVIKGIHPGFVLERKLREKKLKKSRFALTIGEYPQTLNAITKGKRKMNPGLALRIEEALGLEEGYFMVLQARVQDRKSTRLNSSHVKISYAVFCLKLKIRCDYVVRVASQ